MDFGTSNTTLGRPEAGRAILCRLEGLYTTVPSAIFFAFDGSCHIGRAALDAYVEGVEGRLMRSLKSVLGSSLLEEVTRIARKQISFRDVIARFLQGVKARAEAAGGGEITSVVHGRPVHFVDGDPAADRRAEDALREIARAIGFRHVLFQYEPIAAALDYEQHILAEEIALIADIGGGTSDFSIVRLSPQRSRAAERTEDILANDGIRIGGTDFDRVLSLRSIMPLLGFGSPMKRPDLSIPSSYFHDLASWHSINRLYEPRVLREIRQVRHAAAQPILLDNLLRVIEHRQGHALAASVEEAKIDLAVQSRTRIPLPGIQDGFEVELTRDQLASDTSHLAGSIAGRIANLLAQAGLQADDIDALFLTGGSTKLTHLRAAITSALPGAEVIQGDTFGSVGIGLTLDAMRRFGPVEKHRGGDQDSTVPLLGTA